MADDSLDILLNLPDLDPVDQLAILHLVSGATHAEAAAAVGREAKWVQRRLREPYFKAAVAHARAARVARAQDLLDGLFEKSARVIDECLDSGSAEIALKAAALAISTALRLRTAARQEGEIALLRREIAAMQKQLGPEVAS